MAHKRDKTDLYICNRFGSFNPTGNKVREIKNSCKTTRSCPAQILVTKKNKTLTVEYYGTHIGHDQKFQWMRLTEVEQEQIRDDLIATNLNYDIVLNKYNKISSNVQTKLQTVDRRTLSNIARKYNLNLHKNPDENEEIKYLTDYIQSEPLTFRYNDIKYTIVNNGIQFDVFDIVIMNQSQQELFGKFATKAVLMDVSNESTSNKQIKLMTLLVFDNEKFVLRFFLSGDFVLILFISNNSIGVPVANMITIGDINLKLIIFLSVLKSLLGVIKTKVFMSNMEDVYYKSWCNVMGASLKRVCIKLTNFFSYFKLLILTEDLCVSFETRMAWTNSSITI